MKLYTSTFLGPLSYCVSPVLQDWLSCEHVCTCCCPQDSCSMSLQDNPLHCRGGAKPSGFCVSPLCTPCDCQWEPSEGGGCDPGALLLSVEPPQCDKWSCAVCASSNTKSRECTLQEGRREGGGSLRMGVEYARMYILLVIPCAIYAHVLFGIVNIITTLHLMWCCGPLWLEMVAIAHLYSSISMYVSTYIHISLWYRTYVQWLHMRHLFIILYVHMLSIPLLHCLLSSMPLLHRSAESSLPSCVMCLWAW